MSSSPSPYFVDLGEELVGGVAREHVRGARLDPDSDECQLATLLPCPRAVELVIAEIDPDLFVRVRGVGL